MLINLKNTLKDRPNSVFNVGLVLLLITSIFDLWVASVFVIILTSIWFVYCSINYKTVRKRLSAFIYYIIYVYFTITLFADIYKSLGIVSSSKELIEHSDYVYFSIVTFTTLGFGDFTPTPDSRLWAATEAILGYVFLGLFIGLLTNLITDKEK